MLFVLGSDGDHYIDGAVINRPSSFKCGFKI